MDGEKIFSNLFNLVNNKSLLSNLIPLGPCPKSSFLIKCTQIRLILVSFFELGDLNDITDLQ